METQKIKTTEKLDENPERIYSQSIRWPQSLKIKKYRKISKRFCKCCKFKNIFNRTRDDGVVCSCCGIKEGGDSNRIIPIEKSGVMKRFK